MTLRLARVRISQYMSSHHLFNCAVLCCLYLLFETVPDEDCVQTEEAIEVKADMPGVGKGDINVRPPLP